MVFHGEDSGHLGQLSVLRMTEKRFSVRVLLSGLDIFQEFAAIATGEEPSLEILNH